MKRKWDKQRTEAIKASIEHWYENLMMLQLNYLSEQDLNENIYILGDNCALCTVCSESHCFYCPLSITGQKCNDKDSAWYWVYRELELNNLYVIKYKNLFKAITNMINTLESLLD